MTEDSQDLSWEEMMRMAKEHTLKNAKSEKHNEYTFATPATIVC